MVLALPLIIVLVLAAFLGIFLMCEGAFWQGLCTTLVAGALLYGSAYGCEALIDWEWHHGWKKAYRRDRGNPDYQAICKVVDYFHKETSYGFGSFNSFACIIDGYLNGEFEIVSPFGHELMAAYNYFRHGKGSLVIPSKLPKETNLNPKASLLRGSQIKTVAPEELLHQVEDRTHSSTQLVRPG